MCLPIIAVGLMIAATAVSTTAEIQQGQAQKKAADFNAKAQQQTAVSVENQGAQQAADNIQKGRKIASQQAVAGAAGGLRTDTGTPLTLAGETAGFAELDALRITNNAQRSAWGYNTQASLDKYQGDQAQTGSYLSAGSTLLSSASNAYFGGAKAELWGGK